MEKLTFRPLRADEVDVRVATCRANGVSLLLYKDARCDMNILDETVGPERWQRHHSRDNANCTVAIYFPDMGQWVEKEDTGTESNTEAEKGLASDSFKRACFNWGIGRELYTGPFIWVKPDSCDIKTNGQKTACYDRFRVAEMTVTGGRITSLAIANDSRGGAIVFRWNASQRSQDAAGATKATQAGNYAQESQKPAGGPKNGRRIGDEELGILTAVIAQNKLNEAGLCRQYGVAELDELSAEQYRSIMERVQRWASQQKGANE